VRLVRGCTFLRALVDGLTASLVVLALAWLTTGTAASIAFAGPVVVFGVPAAAWQLLRHQGAVQSARTFLAWVAAALPATLLTYPWL